MPRGSQAVVQPGPDRPDPIALLEEQATTRVPELVPIRYGRMLVSPFTFFRGAALIMASDLSTTPRSGLTAQICGDAHLSNFGVFGSPGAPARLRLQRLRRDAPGPLGVGRQAPGGQRRGRGRELGFSKRSTGDAIAASGGPTARRCARWPAMTNLEVWYTRIEIEGVLPLMRRRRRPRAQGGGSHGGDREQGGPAKALTKDTMKALDKLSTVVDGERRFISDPPLVVPADELFPDERRRSNSSSFTSSSVVIGQPADRPAAPARAVRVHSAGAEGGRCGERRHPGLDHDAARARSRRRSCSSRPRRPRRRCSSVSPRRASTPTTVSGWSPASASCRPPATSSSAGSAPKALTACPTTTTCVSSRTGRDRSTRTTPSPGSRPLGRICAHTLARAHARSGDRIAIAAYLGNNSTFDQALAKFAETYADQNERDYEAFAAACKSGRLHAEVGV